MINKTIDNNCSNAQKPDTEPGYIDVVGIDVQCHILIKDKDTGAIILNKRG